MSSTRAAYGFEISMETSARAGNSRRLVSAANVVELQTLCQFDGSSDISVHRTQPPSFHCLDPLTLAGQHTAALAFQGVFSRTEVEELVVRSCG